MDDELNQNIVDPTIANPVILKKKIVRFLILLLRFLLLSYPYTLFTGMIYCTYYLRS